MGLSTYGGTGGFETLAIYREIFSLPWKALIIMNYEL